MSLERLHKDFWHFAAWLWALTGLISWLSSLGAAASPADGSQLSMLALVVAAIGLQFRSKFFIGKLDTTSALSIELLCVIATINWCGFMLLHTTSFFEAVPALAILLVAEVWHLQQFLHLLTQVFPTEVAIIRRIFNSAMLSTAQPTPPEPLPPQPTDVRTSQTSLVQSASSTALRETTSNLEDCESLEIAEDQSSTSGRDAEGRRFSAGTIHIRIDSHDHSREYAQFFSPAFSETPTLDYEITNEFLQVKVLQLGPLGMRLSITRARGSTPETAGRPINGELEWYAVESSTQDTAKLLP